ncbi:MAG: cysteine desulfurase [Clostridia bacterium]|nr:cysteine desulfurase [Clostridia bacterium]
MEERIYFDYAATTPLDKRVLDKMTPYLTDCFGNADSPHAYGRKAMGAVDEARSIVARLIHANENEIYFTSGGTEADNWALIGGARAKRKEGRDEIVLSAIEHHAVLSAAERLEKEGFAVRYLPVNAGGMVEIGEIEKAVSDKTAIVALMAANNETGVLQPIAYAEKIAHKHGALFFTDAVQYAPYKKIDVKEMNADMLAFSGHKFYGPKGVGVLYIKNGVKVEKLIGGGEQERGLRGGTLNVAAIVGLAKAYELACLEMDENGKKLSALASSFIDKLASVGGITRNGAGDNALPSVVNVRIQGVENTTFLFNMDLQGVCLAAGSACASASVKPSHVLTAMGLDEKRAKESVRFSFGKYTTEEEIERGAACAKKIINKLRG